MGLNLAVLRPDRLQMQMCDTKFQRFGLTRVGLTVAGSLSGLFPVQYIMVGPSRALRVLICSDRVPSPHFVTNLA